MEWYICACIITSSKKSIILHAGLAHTDIIIKLLIKIYKFDKIRETGINNLKYMNYTNISGCVPINDKINKFF